MKPTPSIGKPQQSVSLSKMEPETLVSEGIDDLKVFNKREFVGSLFSKDDLV